MIFVSYTPTDLYLTSKHTIPSPISLTSLMSSVKHNLTSPFIVEYTPNDPVKDRTSQLETHSVSTLHELTTTLANIKQYNMSFVSKTNTALPSTTIPVPMLSTMTTRLTPFMELQTTALTTGLAQRKFHTKLLTYNYSRFITPRFSILKREETHSFITKSHQFASVPSTQAETTSTITGLTADDTTSLSCMPFTMTLYSKSVIQPTTAVSGL